MTSEQRARCPPSRRKGRAGDPAASCPCSRRPRDGTRLAPFSARSMRNQRQGFWAYRECIVVGESATSLAAPRKRSARLLALSALHSRSHEAVYPVKASLANKIVCGAHPRFHALRPLPARGRESFANLSSFSVHLPRGLGRRVIPKTILVAKGETARDRFRGPREENGRSLSRCLGKDARNDWPKSGQADFLARATNAD